MSTTMQEVPVRGKEQIIATLLGSSSFEEIDWRTLMKQGVLVRLSIRRCRFTTRLELADLGIPVREARVREALSRTLVLGDKRLLPQDYVTALEKIESRARRRLQRCSFTTELGSFMPVSAYAAWKTEILALREQYFQLRDEIIAKHESLVQQVLSEYAIVAADTYQRIRETSAEALPEGESQEAFVAAYCTRIKALIPDPERIRATFDFTFTLKDGVRELDNDAEAELSAAASSTASVSPEQVRIQSGNREFQQAVMARDLLQQEREQKKAMIDSFLSSIVTQLRALIYEVATDVLATLQKRADDTFSPRSVVQLKNLVRQVSQLNFFGDAEVDRLLAQLQRVVDLSPDARQRSLAEIGQRLRDIATVARSTLLALDEEPRSAREFAVLDVPDETSVREARTNLGLDLDREQFLLRYETREMRLYRETNLWNVGRDGEGEGEREQRLA